MMRVKRRNRRKGMLFASLMRCGMCKALSILWYWGKPAHWYGVELCGECVGWLEDRL